MVQLVNNDGSLFAESTFETSDYERFVQRCVDSSRFFALLLVNEQTGQKANIGIQFPERNDSFDFVGALDQYSKYYRLEKGIDKHGKITGNKDFSIKPGEKLNLNIKGVSG